jgi:hypothetical protein
MKIYIVSIVTLLLFGCANIEKNNYTPTELHGIIGKNSDDIFSEKIQRFTAFRQKIFKGNSLVSDKELPKNKYLFDIKFSHKGQNIAHDIFTNRKFNLRIDAFNDSYASREGFPLQMSIPEIKGKLYINKDKNLFVSIYYDPRYESTYETYYVQSSSLFCSVLNEYKLRYQNKIVGEIFKEALLIGIKSYAGASYSGGNFSAMSTNGNMYSGTYTRYDNSWLGPHYNRGMDAIFSGSASIGEINQQMVVMGCK